MENESTLGLTPDEIEYLRANATSDTAAERVVRQYQMVVVCPNDPGARGIFTCMLDEWRASSDYPAIAA